METTAEEDEALSARLRAEVERLVAEDAALQERKRVRQLDAKAAAIQEIKDDYRAVTSGMEWQSDIYPHQFDGAVFGAEVGRWLLGDEVGLGKTLTSIAWLDMMDAKRVIYVTEAGLVNQVAGEFERFAPHRDVYNLYKKSPARRAEMMREVWKSGHGVLIVNYEVWRRDPKLLESMTRWQADTVIVDEAHNLKRTATANYAYVSTLIQMDNTCPNCGLPMYGFMLAKQPGESHRRDAKCVCGWSRRKEWGVGLKGFARWQYTRSVHNVLLMTGTPLLNSPLDLYSMLHLIDPIEFATEVDFKARFAAQNVHDGKWVFSAFGVKTLRRLMRNYYLARDKQAAGIKLPKQTVRYEVLDFEPDEYKLQQKIIRQISTAASIVLSDGTNATLMHMIALITRKRQANVWPGGIVIREPVTGKVLLDVGTEVRESFKMDAIVDEIMSRYPRRQVVFSQFSTAIDEMATRLKRKGLRVAVLTGDTSDRERTIIKRDFYETRNDYLYDVLIGNYKVAATGLNLTQAKVMHILDEEWNPGKRGQAYGRINRLGQTDETEVIVWRIKRTIDTWLANILARKERMLKQFDEADPRADFTQEAVNVTAAELKDAIDRGVVL